MTLRNVAAVLLASIALQAAAQVPTVLMSRSLVGGLTAPEIKVTLWAIAHAELHPQECFMLIKQVRERMTDRQGTLDGCQLGESEEFSPVARGEPLPNAHYVSYTDTQFRDSIAKFFAVYHYPPSKFNCRYLLDRFHASHPDAICIASR